MAINVTGNIRFSNDNSILYFPPNEVNQNNDYFSGGMTIASTPSYPTTVTATNSTIVTESATLVSGSAGGGDFIINGGQTTLKISGNYVLDSGTSDALFKPYRIFDDTTDIIASTGTSTGIGATFPRTMITGSSDNGQLRIYSGENTAELYFDSEGYTNVSKEAQKFIKRQNLKRNLVINIKSRADLIRDIPENEQVAIETLREEITETEFRKYVKYGFVLVEGQSGKTYQVFRNRSHTKVWKGGKFIEEICVRIKDSEMPPTDNVIAFLNMIQIDENEFRKIGNIYKMQRAA